MAPPNAHLPGSALLLLLLLHLRFFLLPSPPLAVAKDDMPDLPPGILDPSKGMPDIPLGLMDGAALLMFKDCLGNPAVLSSWAQGVDPCDKKRPPWAGVVCIDGVVEGIRLGGMGLSGTLNESAVMPLIHMQGLRSISLTDNNLSGEIPPFGELVALKSLFLSNNKFSGTIEEDFFSDMAHLKKVWLSGNAFTGKIPSSLSKLSHLMELRLENNQFSGSVPAMNIPSLTSFNVSNNKLEGEIPAGLARFDASSFKGNAGLCGPEVGTNACVATPAGSGVSNGKDVRSGRAVVVGVVLAMMLLALVAGLLVVKKRREEVFDTLGVENGHAESMSLSMPPGGASSYKSHGGGSSKRTSGSCHRRHDSSRKGSSKGSSGGSSDGPGDLMMVNHEKGAFGLPDLMKAAAEVLGNGGMGSSYKAVMANGVAVVVKRMRDLNRMGRDGFEVEIRRLGRLRHPNVLTPLAYHYRKEEKLLVLEYIEKGSLLFALHGDRGVHHAALDWPTRLKIVRGIAQGLAYLHAELAASDVPHGNLKSGNVLLGPSYEPLLVDYGFVPLVNPSQASVSMFAYKSPEAVQQRQVSSKSDVYCLGVVILEVITGKFPSQYLNNGKGGTDVVEWAASAVAERREAELIDPDIAAGARQSLASMERLLGIGAACVDPRPEMRPDAKEAARRIEGIADEGAAGEGTSAAAGDFDAVPLQKAGNAVLTTRLSTREHAGEAFSIS